MLRCHKLHPLLLRTSMPPPQLLQTQARSLCLQEVGQLPPLPLPMSQTQVLLPHLPAVRPLLPWASTLVGQNAKPLVTFAPPGVSGRQQNLGFSASLQPTTQSNSGSSANLVGGFGATHPGSTSTTTQSNLGFSADSVGGLGATRLGSINTTTGTLGSNHVPRKKGNSSMLSPYSGSIDPSSLTSIAKYINFVKLPYNERLDCLVANRNLRA
jgi:hypothetical protein